MVRLWAQRRFRVASVCVAMLLLFVVAFTRYIGVWGGNIRTVTPGRLYRSAQLPAGQLRELIRDKGIRTVISLRGGTPDDSWFRRESAVCASTHASFEVLRFSASALPKPDALAKLIQTFDHAKYPVLIHCRSGADRTGLVATLYLNLYERVPLDTALRRCLTWHQGHFGYQSAAMDRFFELYRESGEKTDLRTWIEKDYPGVYQTNQSRDARHRPVTAISPGGS